MDFPYGMETRVGQYDVDRVLACEMRAGVDGAFDRLYHQYATYVYNTCLAMLGHPEDARDALQDTFVQVYRSIAGYRGDSLLSTWIYRIAVRKCVDMMRRNRRHDTLPWQEAPVAEPETPDFALEGQVRRALLALKVEYRIVLVLFHYQGLSYGEIARVVGATTDQVRVRIYRARQAFRAAYIREGGADAV